MRADYTQKARDLKALQKLRDQQREAWRLETQRAEQAELDELAAMARSVKAIREQAAERQTQEVC